jgi:hypothetical protein
VVVALVWEWLYQPNYGVLNDLLFRAGWLHERVAWLSDPRLAMPAVIATNVWRGVPFFAIMLLAGLQAIPTSCTRRRAWTAPGARPLPARDAAAAASHHRGGHGHAHHLDVQLRRSHLRHDERRTRHATRSRRPTR